MLRPAEIAFALIHYRWRWLIPTLLLSVVGLGAAILKEDSWEATQRIVLRDEALPVEQRPGEFVQRDDMKLAQETVLQLTRSREVIAAALEDLGPPSNRWFPAAWPSKEDIAATRKKIDVHSPGGTEFGTTEMLFITVESDTPARAKRLNELICRELDKQFAEMRNQQSTSLVEELEYRESQSRKALQSSTEQLAKLEAEVGTDLAELRLLNEVGSGNGNLREQILQIKSELRAASDRQQASEQLLKFLNAANANPAEILATSNSLLESQPALRRLKEGLIDAQLRTAALQGTQTEDHPNVAAAHQAEVEIRGHLHQEIEVARRGILADLRVNTARIEQLTQQLNDVNGRMTKLATLRASYGNLVADVRQRNEKLTKIHSLLADARSSVETAGRTSLMTKVNQAEVSDYPVGPSRKLIAASGLFGGLACGIGLLFLTTPAEQSIRSTRSGHHAHGGASNPAPPTGSHGLSLKDALNQLTQRSPSRN